MTRHFAAVKEFQHVSGIVLTPHLTLTLTRAVNSNQWCANCLVSEASGYQYASIWSCYITLSSLFSLLVQRLAWLRYVRLLWNPCEKKRSTNFLNDFRYFLATAGDPKKRHLFRYVDTYSIYNVDTSRRSTSTLYFVHIYEKIVTKIYSERGTPKH